MSHDPVIVVGDTSAIALAVSTFFGWLPDVAALFSVLWLATRIYEAFTGQPFHETRLAQILTLRW